MPLALSMMLVLKSWEFRTDNLVVSLRKEKKKKEKQEEGESLLGSEQE